MANKGSTRTTSKTPKRRKGDSSSGATDEHERDKDFLSEQEIETLRKEARTGRYGERDDCLVLMLYRHGLRASEAAELRIKDLDLKTSRLWVGRLKGSLSTHQPIEGDELRDRTAVIQNLNGVPSESSSHQMEQPISLTEYR